MYQYNKNKQLTKITRPDLQTLDFSYNPTSGKLSSITAPDNGQLAYGYGGSLLKDTTWSGSITGSVNRSYNADFNVTELKVNGLNPVTFQYDNDQLLTQAGSLTLTRSPQNGLLTGTTQGSLIDSYTYNTFGEVSNYLAKYTSSELYKAAYTRDKLGRITQKVETVNSSSHTYNYAYDIAGHLIEEKRDNTVLATYGYDQNGNRTDLNGVPICPLRRPGPSAGLQQHHLQLHRQRRA